jgi:hypothetical protein
MTQRCLCVLTAFDVKYTYCWIELLDMNVITQGMRKEKSYVGENWTKFFIYSLKNILMYSRPFLSLSNLSA